MNRELFRGTWLIASVEGSIHSLLENSARSHWKNRFQGD